MFLILAYEAKIITVCVNPRKAAKFAKAVRIERLQDCLRGLLKCDGSAETRCLSEIFASFAVSRGKYIY